MSDRRTKDAALQLQAAALLLQKPETVEERRAREDREFLESIRLDLPLPKLTEADYVRSMKPDWKGWRPLGTSTAEKAAAEEKAARDRWEIDEIAVTPDPIF